MKKGITYEDVVEAAQALIEQGIKPTVAACRKQLGGGSPTTITPYLRRWKNQQALGGTLAALPLELAETVTSIYERLIEASREPFEKRETELLTDLEVKTDEIELLKKQKKAVGEELAELVSNYNELNSQFDQVKIELVQAAIDKKEVDVFLECAEQDKLRLKARAEKADAALIATTNQSKHLEQRMRDDHDREHKAAEKRSTELKTKISSLEQKLTDSSGKLTVANQEIKTLEYGLKSENQKVIAVERDIERLEEELNNSKKSNQSLLEKMEKTEQSHLVQQQKAQETIQRVLADGRLLQSKVDQLTKELHRKEITSLKEEEK